MIRPEDSREAIISVLRERLPNLLAVYAFGSRALGLGHARPDSDLDLALLVSGYVDSATLDALAAELDSVAGCVVDLIDLSLAPSVMQFHVITKGECWWSQGTQAEFYETVILGEKFARDRARSLTPRPRESSRTYSVDDAGGVVLIADKTTPNNDE